jgi:thioredoxin reductase (NADPH)
VRLFLFSEVEEIKEAELLIKDEHGRTHALPNDAVFVLIGSDADLSLLRDAGVRTERAGLTEVPSYDPDTFETNVPGLYVAGHFTNSRHIKEAIAVPRQVVPLIAQSLRATV